jgi:hypothetical protein
LTLFTFKVHDGLSIITIHSTSRSKPNTSIVLYVVQFAFVRRRCDKQVSGTKYISVSISSFIYYSATAFATGTFINYFTISFYIVARYDWI